MNSKELKAMHDAIYSAIAVTVNGKIDKLSTKIDSHNSKHEEDMKRIMPVVEAYEDAIKFSDEAKKNGTSILRGVMWTSTFVASVGGAWIILKQVFHF